MGRNVDQELRHMAPNITGSHGHSPRAPGAGVSGANTGTQDTAEIEEGEMAMPGE